MTTRYAFRPNERSMESLIEIDADDHREKAVGGIIRKYPKVLCIQQHDEDGKTIASYDVETAH